MTRFTEWFANTRVRNKILTGYSALLLFMLLIGIVVVLQAGRIAAANEENRRIEHLLLSSQEIAGSFSAMTSALQNYLITGDEQALVRYNRMVEELRASLRRALELTRDQEQVARLQAVAAGIRAWEESVAAVVIPERQRTLRADPDALAVIPPEIRQRISRMPVQEIRATLEELEARERTRAELSRREVEQAVERMRWAVVLFIVLAALIATALAVWIADRISRQLNEAVTLASAVAGGDLTRQMRVRGRDEVGTLMRTLNEMAGDLRRMITGVSTTTTQVASAAQQIAAASEEISYTADQQVRATEETSSSMEQIAAQIGRVARSTESLTGSVDQTSSSITQMSNSIEQTAASTEALGASVEETSATIEEMVASISRVGQHVRETREIARGAEGDARAGGDAVARTIEGMRRIHTEMERLVESTRELRSTSEAIGQISEVIEDIADQTNLLALNAAIEAARAGEHGRGFAVVAEEIRRLAERSIESTREIGQTIRSVLEDVGQAVRSTGEVAERTREGIGLADTAGQALEKIIDSSGRTRGLMEEVSLATEQQIGAAEQAQEAIQHIQRVTAEARIATREQATASREIAEAVENMNRQTREMFAATEEQKRGGEMIVSSTENINQGARSTQEAIQEMANAAQELSGQASRLSELVAEFRV